MQTLESDGKVLRPVLLKPREMVFLAIGLNGDALVDNEIDGSGITDEHLRPDVMPARSKPGAGEALREAVAPFIHPVPDVAQALRQSKNDRLEVERVELAGAQSPVERCDGDLEWLVKDYAVQSIDEANGYDGAP